MRILFQSDHVLGYRMHGISRMSIRVLESLEKRGHECVGFDGDFTGELDGDVLLLPANGLVGVPEQQCDLLIECGIPIASIIYDIIPYVFNENKEERYRRRLQDTIDVSKRIITISEHSKQDIRKHLGCAKPIRVIRPGVPFEPPITGPREPDDYFLSVGGYGERKGHRELLQAILKTQQQLIMVGQRFYYDEATHDLAHEATDNGLLIELEDVDDPTLIDLYQHARALIYPTKYEGFGLPIIEAMSCGCPVITTSLTATPEAARDAACFIEPTTDAIVDAIDSLEEQRNWLRTQGLLRIANDPFLKWDRIAQLYEKGLDKI